MPFPTGNLYTIFLENQETQPLTADFSFNLHILDKALTTRP